MTSFNKTKLGFLVFTTCFLTACGGESLTYESQNEIPSGPGLFSGAEGGYTKSIDLKSNDNQESYQEFQAFNQWKANKEKDPEFQEFLAWQKWKALKKQNK